MARWEPDSCGRLEKAALDLFEARGFEHTTVADIADAAGVTERTFFRYFAEKRDVLFGTGTDFQDAFTTAIDAAPASASAMDAVADAVEAGALLLADRHVHARRRSAVIAASPELRERERSKLAAVASAMAEHLRARDVPEPRATLASEVGMTVFHHAFTQWVAGEGDDLRALVHAGVDELRSTLAN